jgi:DNA-directed RNA polymerase subunit RPC12/RpoP
MTRTFLNKPDELACYRKLVQLLHPEGLACPRCGSRNVEQHGDSTAAIPPYRCGHCQRCFDAWTGTLLQGAGCAPSEIYAALLCVLDRVARRDVRHNEPRLTGASPGRLSTMVPNTLDGGNPSSVRMGSEVN